MYVETSALVAILKEEPGTKDLVRRISVAQRPVTSVVSAVEAALAIGRAMNDYPAGSSAVRELLARLGISMQEVGPETYDDVLLAYARYGKGTGHPAQLNFGDCFSHACAKGAGGLFLYVGNDFAHTDLA
jgi:ribonuclease VapC